MLLLQLADKHGLESRGIERWRLLVAVSMFLWGFWYPPYILCGRLVFKSAELQQSPVRSASVDQGLNGLDEGRGLAGAAAVTRFVT
jgi:hypothetical protein